MKKIGVEFENDNLDFVNSTINKASSKNKNKVKSIGLNLNTWTFNYILNVELSTKYNSLQSSWKEFKNIWYKNHNI